MRHRNPARPFVTLAAACLIAAPVATPQQARTPAAPQAQPALTGAAAIPGQPSLQMPPGPLAITVSSDPETLAKQLTGKTFYLRGFYQDDHLEFDTNGSPAHPLQKGSFALSAVEIDSVKFTKHSMEMKAHRLGLHFFGALPYEDDSKPFELIKVDPKKSIEIDLERLVIEPEKKKKKKEIEKEQAAKNAAAAQAAGAVARKSSAATTPGTPASTPAGTSTNAAESASTPTPAAPGDGNAIAAQPAAASAAVQTAAAVPAQTAAAVPAQTAVATPPAVSPEHDLRISFQQLSKAINVIFAPGLNDSVIATLPPYWQNYFATKAGRSRAAKLDASALRPGGEVKPPQLLTALDPASNEYAQRNNIAGLIFLQTVVDANGQPGEITIVRPIGFGLDEKAVDAVQHSRFRPGTVNGTPVTEVVNLQVTFRIYSERTRPTGAPAPAATPAQVAPRQSPKGTPSTGPVLAAATVPE
jgi:TonB family protein